MYLQITTRCNMSCAHCCMSATEHGEDMSLAVLMAALEWAKDYGDDITVGGGEPTLHPEFEKFLCLVMMNNTCEFEPLVVTNGSNTERTLGLLRMKGVHTEVSIDPWHDPISLEVEERLTKATTRTVQHISATGRAKSWGENRCCCDTLFVCPNGDVYFCGCKKQKLGNILVDTIPYREDQCDFLS